MAARVTATQAVSIDAPAALANLESAMERGGLRAVVVEIPEDSSALLSAREFRQLMRVAQINGVEIQITTDDPLRRELASILGAPLSMMPGTQGSQSKAPARSAPASGHPDTGAAPARRTNDQPTRRLDSPTIHPPAVRDAPEEAFESSSASFSFVLTPPTSRRAPSMPALDDDDVDTYIAKPPRGAPALRRKRARLLTLMATLGAGLGAAFLIVALLVPTATVTLTPAVAPIAANYTYGVAAPGVAYDLTLEPRSISTTLVFNATIPTTGERFEPDAPARGEVLLTNATTAEITIPAGTLFTASGGQTYATTADVVAPAADPYGSMTFGSVTAAVVARQAGPDGNVDAEAIYGQLDNGIFYSNREPIGGGTTRRIATVAQADLDALRAKAAADLTPRASSALAPQLQQGDRLLDGSLRQGDISAVFDKPLGADATSIRVDASLQVTGQAYNLDAGQQQAREAAATRLAALVGQGSVVLADTVRFSEPEPIVGAPAPAFRIRASADTRAVIDAATLAALRDDLTGTSKADAERIVASVAGVSERTIVYRPDWLPARMPRLNSKITIKVIAGGGTATSLAPQPQISSGP